MQSSAAAIGLLLNPSKCEIVGLSLAKRTLWEREGLGFSSTSVEAATMLGSPLGSQGVDSALSSNGDLLKRISPRLSRLTSHEAFFLLKNCFAVPRLSYTLRSAPCFLSGELLRLEGIVRDTISSIMNVNLSDDAWLQASFRSDWVAWG